MSQDVYVVVEHMRGQIADISSVLLAGARLLAQGVGGKVVGVVLGEHVRALAVDLPADRVLIVEHPALAEFSPESYHRVLVHLMEGQAPRAVLFGDTSIGAEVAGRLSASTGLPLVCRCRDLRVDQGAPKFVSQICGGKVMAEGDLPGPTALVTMVPGGFKVDSAQAKGSPELIAADAPDLQDLRVTLKQYHEPEAGDVDIGKVPILVAVGRGIQRQDNLDLAEGLAAALGGSVCASRPVVDQGWLAASRLVGKSGKKVRPKLYLAVGISGAPEHIEGIADAEMIVAINTDRGAPIFDIAKYGTATDLFDLIPVLTEKAQQARAR